MSNKEERKIIISFLLVLLISSITNMIGLTYLWIAWYIYKNT